METSTSPTAPKPDRSKNVTWADPRGIAAAAGETDGLTFLRAMIASEVPPPPIANLLSMRLVAADTGRAVFELDPDESQYNPIGTVHGGTMCTLLDSAVGCAVHSTLPQGSGYTSVEIKVNYLRPVTLASGMLTATAVVTKPGRRIAFAEAEVVDAAGKVVANATSTLLVFPLPA
jgi:uncharacterized protein (TIGR00369 family)